MAANLERFCVVIGRTRHKMVLTEIQEAARAGARLVEVRLDFLPGAVDFKRLLAKKPCPLVATVRRGTDGGRWAGTEEARQMLLRQAVVAGFDWIDLETDVADKIRRYKDVKRIVSYHNLVETPADLDEIYAGMTAQDADVLKLAVTAQTPADNLRVLNLLANAPRPTVAHCMGEIGFPSRLLALRYPATPFIYAAFTKERGIAPGLPSFQEMKTVYGGATIDARTQVFGVIGDPVAHSHSPLLHNAVFRHLGLNAIYLPFRVPRGQLPGFLEAFQAVPVQGYSVTIPHKEAAARCAAEADEVVKQTQSANTLLRRESGFAARNTDYQAILDSLRAHLPPDGDGRPPFLTGKAALVLGCGGVARSVVHALHQAGAKVVVAGRTFAKGAQLAAEVDGHALEWTARHSIDCDLLVNGTPVGMHPNVDESPIHPSYLKPGLVVLDTVYNPETTLLIKEARARGCTTVTGLDMFVRQAGLQFHLFTGHEPPLEQMRHLLRRALSPVTTLWAEEA